MYYLKLLSFPLFILLAFDSPAGPATRWLITKGCSLKVEGSTNINKFSCVIVSSFRPDTLTFSPRATGSESTSISGALRLDVREFNCHNPMMTGDLRKTLKAKEFPRMVIRFISLSRYPDTKLKAYPISGLVSIELAGVTRKFNVAYTVSPSGSDILMLKGVREIKFSDFNIVPPRKIGGMIQTNDKLIAEFNLVLTALND